jgi:hypothetical protein
LEYDYCPEPSEAFNIVEDYFDHDLNDLQRILKEYEGWSPSNLTKETYDIIEDL